MVEKRVSIREENPLLMDREEVKAHLEVMREKRLAEVGQMRDPQKDKYLTLKLLLTKTS